MHLSKLIALIALTYGCVAQGATIIASFEFTITNKYYWATGSNDPDFQPLPISVSAVFDDAVTNRVVEPDDVIIDFGPPEIDSPLTALLPYAPGIPIEPSTDSLISDYHSATQNFSNFQLLGNAMVYETGGFYSYHIGIQSPMYPPLTNPLTFSDADLFAYLQQLRSDGATIYISEYTDHFDSVNSIYLGGVWYTGSGVITELYETPEPTTWMLLIGAVPVLGIRRLVKHHRRG